MSTNPYDRLSETGDAAWKQCRPRSDNPHPQGSVMWQTWLATWDTAAQEGARILQSNAAGDLYRAGLDVASLLRDMRSSPRTLTTRSTRFRDVEVSLSAALSKASSCRAPSGSPSAPSGRLPTGESEGAMKGD